MNVSAAATREAIAAGLGLGAAATAALFTKTQPPQQVRQPPTENVASRLQLDSLAQEIQSLDQGQLEQMWTQEFTSAQDSHAANVWSDEFVTLTPDMDQAWTESVGQQWTEELEPRRLTTELPSAADFMSTVEQELRSNESQLASQWANEFQFQFNPGTTNWVSEFTMQNEQEQFLHKLQSEWDQQLQLAEETHSWLTPTSNPALNQEYKFSGENGFMSSKDPLAEGRAMLEQGNIPSAVLAFEAAVQRNPEDLEGWVELGKAQAQNEQDPKAIPALNHALRIQPHNLAALLALAASLTNEAFQLQAAHTLKNWLIGNPKYSHLITSSFGSQPPESRISSVVSKEELRAIQESFLEAARLNPNQDLDPDVQCGLGILFNLGTDYEKAADCFRAALSLRPNDSLLWNRLGATLANGGKSAEAISAYRRALELTPGFIRTWYNLGISCSNLGANKEAAQHFLTALNQQSTGKESSLMSNSIWTSLRIVLPLMGRTDLVSAVDSRNLRKLNQEILKS